MVSSRQKQPAAHRVFGRGRISDRRCGGKRGSLRPFCPVHQTAAGRRQGCGWNGADTAHRAQARKMFAAARAAAYAYRERCWGSGDGGGDRMTKNGPACDDGRYGGCQNQTAFKTVGETPASIMFFKLCSTMVRLHLNRPLRASLPPHLRWLIAPPGERD